MTIPITTSPGRSGFGPQLSLSYDSGAGNGPFGLGWHLSLPSISRKTDKGLPRYIDGEESDVFILSGAEDLVPVLVKNGDNWVRENLLPRNVNGTNYRIQRYRPRIEGLFARIERWTNVTDASDTFWRSISKDNITTWYGRTAESRITDPADNSRIFSWLICQSYDDKGNVIVYGYKREDSVGVDLAKAHERNRGDKDDSRRKTNRYLKRIRYGNRTPYLPILSATAWPDPPSAEGKIDASADWLFEVVFDYGEHAKAIPKPNDDSGWPVRNDPFSSYRACFDVRTYRLCQRVLMFHHFPDEPDVGADCLVRSTDFDYSYEENPTDARNPIYSFLLSVAQSGYRRQGADYLNKSLPPVEFNYSEVPSPENLAQQLVREVDAQSLEDLPVGLDGGKYQWVDLDGEGASGILTEQADGWYYKRNFSPINLVPENGNQETVARFGPTERVASKPSPVLASGTQFLDLVGDGHTDLVQMEGPVRGFYERTDDAGWEPFRPFTSWPDLDTHNPDLRFVDLTGDGHADILITEAEVLTWYPSLAEKGFGSALRVSLPLDEERGPRLVFADGTQSIYLADLSGDGLSDLVRIRNGEVCYWANVGYGRFGPKVTMDNAPWFDSQDQFDQRRIRLADTDGSGTTDILYLHRDGVRIYFNQSGNSWSNAVSLQQFPPINNVSYVQALDLLGSGTACLVWSSSLPGDARRPMRYVDLMEQKPHLLVKMVNNLGAETVVSYVPSTKFYLQDEFDEKPWITRLPFPVHVVERVETYDRISGNRFVSRYSYHHGYFDGVEREFRGFGRVEQLDTEEIGSVPNDETSSLATNLDAASFVPPILTKTWFHTGVYDEIDEVSRHFAAEYYGAPELNDSNYASKFDAFKKMILHDTILPPGLTPDEEREACRALKGSMLRQEVYAKDAPDGASKEIIQRANTPYTVTEQNFTIEPLQPQGSNRHAVFFTHAREALSYQYERIPDDPRTQHAMTLEVDAFGNVLKSGAIGYGRHGPDLSLPSDPDRGKQTLTLITYTERTVTSPVDENIKKPDGTPKYLDDYRTPLTAETRTYELTGYVPTGPAGRFQVSDFTKPDPNDPDGHKQVHIFDSEINYEEQPSNGKQRRLIEQVRTLYRKDDLTGLLPIKKNPTDISLESLALPGETYKLAFTPGLISQIYKRKIGAPPEENLLPDPTQVLGGKDSDQGGYVDLDNDGHWWIPSGRVYFDPLANIANPSATAATELTQALNHFFLPRKFTDPFDHSSLIDYEGHDLLVARTQDALQNTVSAVHDYRVLQPTLITDPNGNRSAAAFDALGLVVATALMGKKAPAPVEGDLLEGFDPDPPLAAMQTFVTDPKANAATFLGKATTRIVYDLDRFKRCGQPPFAASLARETHFANPGGANTKIQVSFSYSDGFGREIQKKIQAEPGDGPQRQANVPLLTGDILPGDLSRDAAGKLILANVSPRWVGTGRTIFNNKGKPVKQYEPFFSSTHLYEPEPEMTDTGVTPIIFYDSAERVVATLHPNHSWEKVVFDPWQQTTYDINDTVLIPIRPTDPNRDKDVEGFFSRLPEGDYLPTWHELRTDALQTAKFAMMYPDAAMRESETSAAQKAAAHANTSAVTHFDSLGRIFLTFAHNGFEADGTPIQYPTRVELDIEGNQRAVRDAITKTHDAQGNETVDELGRIVMRYDYDMLGNRIHQASMEAGERWMLNDVTGKPVRAWDSRGFIRRITYDELRRPTGLFVTENGAKRQAERTVYGESQGTAGNHRTRVFQVFDAAGIKTSEGYDFKGNLLSSRRDLLPDYKKAVDWAQNPVANDGTFTTSTTYDALNRPITVTSPDGSIYLPTFNEANLLDKVDVNLRGTAAVTSFVTNIDYNAKGQRALIAYGNGAQTTYEYDPLTFRLTRLRTRRAAGLNGISSQLFTDPSVVQDLHYTYDPAGNLTRIADTSLARLSNSGPADNAPSDYTYDAIYRLVEATGREHIGQTARVFNPPDGNRRDYPFSGLTDFIAHPNDLQAMRLYTEQYDYDPVSNFKSMRHVANGGSWTRDYEYQAASLIEPAKQSNRLTKTTVGNGATNSETYTYTDSHGGDVHGCMTAINSMKMDWDFKDQLQQVDLGGGGTAYYVYDAAGERVRKVIEMQGGTLSEERLYLGGFESHRKYNGNSFIRETLHITENKQRIAFVETKTHEFDAPIANLEPLIRFQLGNHLGSASVELDKDGGLISYEEYHPYGTTAFQAMSSAAEVSLKRYRNTGKERDEESGTYYHGARYYATWLGRWTAVDPLTNASGSSYAYVNNHPVDSIDPDGRDERDVNSSYKDVSDPRNQIQINGQNVQQTTSGSTTFFGGEITGTGRKHAAKNDAALPRQEKAEAAKNSIVTKEEKWEAAEAGARNWLVDRAAGLIGQALSVPGGDKLADHVLKSLRAPEPTEHPTNVRALEVKENYEAMRTTLTVAEIALMFVAPMVAETAAGEAIASESKLAAETKPAAATPSQSGGGSVGAMARYTPEETILNNTEVAAGRRGAEGLRRAEGDFHTAEGMFDDLRVEGAPVRDLPRGISVAPSRAGGEVTLRPGGTKLGPGGIAPDQPRLEIHGAQGGVFDQYPRIKIIFEGYTD
jgi:RHS repeat-associated protein